MDIIAVKEYFSNTRIIYNYLYIIICKKYKQRIVRLCVCIFIVKFSDSMCVYSLQKTEEICSLSPKCSFFVQAKEGFCDLFSCIKGFQNGKQSDSFWKIRSIAFIFIEFEFEFKFECRFIEFKFIFIELRFTFIRIECSY